MPSECFIFSSNPDNGAINRSTDGSRFTIQFNDPFFLPSNARNAKLQVVQANIWNVSPNISASLGNNILQITDINGTHTVEIETGLYDIDTLFLQIEHQFNNIPGNRPAFPFNDMVDMYGNESTNRLYIEFKYNATLANLQFIWANSTISDILGFTPASLTKPTDPSTATSTFTLRSDNSPKFNIYNSYIIHSDIVSAGIRINNDFDRVIAQIPIKASVGELDAYRAQEPSVFSLCNNLIGVSGQRWSIEVWLTSETGVPLDQRGEYYDIIVLISWLEIE